VNQRFLNVAVLCAVLGVLTVLVALGGCSKRYQIDIESDTCWQGNVDSQGISGCGNSTYKVIGPMRCVVLSKQTPIGYLRVRIDGRAWTETSAPYGSLEACE
jgi:hypothetical protein